MSQNMWGWSNGGVAPTHMNFVAPISMTGTPGSLWKCGTISSVMPLAQPGCSASETCCGRGRHHSGPRQGFLVIRLLKSRKQRTLIRALIQRQVPVMWKRQIIWHTRRPALAFGAAILFAAAALPLASNAVDGVDR